MGTSPSGSQEPTSPPDSSTVILLLRDIADTTWRMFVPTIGMTLVGIWLDRSLGTRPWCAVVGTITGSLVAGVLIRMQFKMIKTKL